MVYIYYHSNSDAMPAKMNLTFLGRVCLPYMRLSKKYLLTTCICWIFFSSKRVMEYYFLQRKNKHCNAVNRRRGISPRLPIFTIHVRNKTLTFMIYLIWQLFSNIFFINVCDSCYTYVNTFFIRKRITNKEIQRIILITDYICIIHVVICVRLL